jgi:hypothetical protein
METEQRKQIVRIKKVDEDRRIVYGEVYAPMQLDSHGEFMLAEDIETMAHRFLTLDNLAAKIDTNHDNVPNGSYPIESFIAREGDPDYTPGAWVLGVKITDDLVWGKVKSGELNGYSFQSLVKPVEMEVTYEVIRDHVGETEADKDDDHRHVYFVQMGEDGRVVRGWTSEVNGHRHKVLHGTATAFELGHAHRFFL